VVVGFTVRIVAHAASFLFLRPIRPWARCDEFVTIAPGGEFAGFQCPDFRKRIISKTARTGVLP
jgi:hypothetical protein